MNTGAPIRRGGAAAGTVVKRGLSPGEKSATYKGSALAAPVPAQALTWLAAHRSRALSQGLSKMPGKPKLHIVLCAPRGFCAGVVRAIDVVETALKIHGPPVYVRHEIVHNKHVVDSLKAKGVVFIKELSEAPLDRAGDFFGAWGRAGRCRRKPNGAELNHRRRDMSAGHQGASRGAGPSQARAPRHPRSATSATPKSPARWASCRRAR